jgi:hypothetical protein
VSERARVLSGLGDGRRELCSAADLVADRARERPSVRRSWAWTRSSSEALGCILCRRMPSNGIHDHYGREVVKPITAEDMNPVVIY